MTEQLKQRERMRDASRSRSRDRYPRKERLRNIILQYFQDIGETIKWNSKNDDLLEQLIKSGKDDQDIKKQFKNQKYNHKKEETYEGAPQLTYEQYLQKEQQFHGQQELIRAFMRIEQQRELPIDRFIKIVYIYKGKYNQESDDALLLKAMKYPKQTLQQLSVQQLKKMLHEAEIHLKSDAANKTQFVEYWNALIELIRQEVDTKSKQPNTLKPQIQQKIDKIMNKELADLIKMQKSIIATQKQMTTYNENSQFWNSILKRIKIRKLESVLVGFLTRFKQNQKEQQSNFIVEQKINTSPILCPKNVINPKFLVTQQEQILQRSRLAQRIFKQDFQKSRQKLQNNLSLPKNHNLLQETIIKDVNATYDYIAEQILQFQRYKRLEEDEEDFNDWLPVQTEGRFRDRRPVYVNRVRMAFEWNRYNQLHYDSENPPPKTVQGYKFNIFYPHLLDKTKTPQYYFQATESNDFAIIKFKAGPPYLDLAFKIVNREWDFSQKSGFESIFAKGILHLYFNFKKPRYRI